MPKLINNLHYQNFPKCRALAAIFQLLLALTVLNAKVGAACATLSPEISVSDNYVSDSYGNAIGDMSPNDGVGLEQKRSWQSLQGPWGKRAAPDPMWNAEPSDADGDIFLAEHLMPVLLNNGGDQSDPLLKYSLVYLTNAATLDRLANRQEAERDSADMDDDIWNAKRTWKSMNMAWGKRRNAPAWNKFRGAWGKREPSWNNLKGMWGKRTTKDWQKLHGGWGKRAEIN